MTDADGRRVPDAGARGGVEWGGGLSVYSTYMLARGKSVPDIYCLDARDYIQTPSPGKYTLQLVYRGDIANDPNLTGKIVWKSKPVSVVVEYFALSSKWESLRVPFAILAGIGWVCGSSLFFHLFWKREVTDRPLLGRRDWWALGVIALLAFGWGADTFNLKDWYEQRPEVLRSNWTMRLAE